MTLDDYAAASVGGALRLKGTAGVSKTKANKKKKKKSKQPATAAAEEAILSAATETAAKTEGTVDLEEEEEEGREKEKEMEEVETGGPLSKTEAELRFEETRRKRVRLCHIPLGF